MSEDGGHRVVAFAGSLRRGSFNSALIRAARDLAPEGMSVDLIEIGGLPFYRGRRATRRPSPRSSPLWSRSSATYALEYSPRRKFLWLAHMNDSTEICG